MTASVLAASRAGQWWLVPVVAAVVALNGLGHLVGSLATRSYSPGLVSGLLLWLPLGIAGLQWSRTTLPPQELWWGIAGGVLAQLFVGLSAAMLGRMGTGRGFLDAGG